MGFNSLLLINNDAMGAVDEDPVTWWGLVKRALSTAMREPATFGFKGFANYFTAIWCQHADTMGLIAVGGNRADILVRVPRMVLQYGTLEELHLAVLKAAADKMGYQLRRKPKKKDESG